MSKERDKILAKIKALLSKTTENGCTEAEAMAALGKAHEMMEGYEVTDDDVREAEEEGAVFNERTEKHDLHGIRRFLVVSVGLFTGCKPWTGRTKSRYWSVSRFCGLRADVEYADWLLDSLHTFIEHELAKYMVDKPTADRNLRRRFVNGFTMGAVHRINARLMELMSSQRKETATGTALVVVRTAAIQKRMEQDGPKLKATSSQGRLCKDDAYERGKDAGDRASFGRPVGSGSTKALTGGN